MLRKFDPFTERWIEESPEYPIWQRPNSAPQIDRRDQVINHAARTQKIILDQPGRRYEPGAGEAAEKPRHRVIKG
jgi:hypothetical protein